MNHKNGKGEIMGTCATGTPLKINILRMYQFDINSVHGLNLKSNFFIVLETIFKKNKKKNRCFSVKN